MLYKGYIESSSVCVCASMSATDTLERLTDLMADRIAHLGVNMTGTVKLELNGKTYPVAQLLLYSPPLEVINA